MVKFIKQIFLSQRAQVELESAGIPRREIHWKKHNF